MSDIESLRRRFERLNGARPACAALLGEIEKQLAVRLPEEFKRICEFYDGSGLNVIPMFSIGTNAPEENPLLETLRLREAIAFPGNWVAIAEPPESLVIMDCLENGRVLWIDAIDARRVASGDFLRQPDVWESFSEFFSYVLDEEEEDRAS